VGNGSENLSSSNPAAALKGAFDGLRALVGTGVGLSGGNCRQMPGRSAVEITLVPGYQGGIRHPRGGDYQRPRSAAAHQGAI
jgi:hypothetical protein